MKRLSFKREFVPLVLSGAKRWTSRWELKYAIGDIAAATTASKGRPAFLVPAKEAFAVVQIVDVRSKFWKDFTEEHAQLCGVTRAWYLKERPCAGDLDRIHMLEFKVLQEGPPVEGGRIDA